LRSAEFGPLTADQVDTLRRIDQTAQELLRLVNATLDVSRLESGKAVLDIADVELADLLGELRDEMRDAENKGAVSVHWPRLPPGFRLRTDRVKLKVILKNLVGNAIKFTDEGTVDIAAEVDDRTAVFTVRDTGIGIPADALETIFEWFRQLESSMTRRHGGIGLGLYLARRLAEMLGGTITVESVIHRGSTFRLEIPRAAAAPIAGMAGSRNRLGVGRGKRLHGGLPYGRP